MKPFLKQVAEDLLVKVGHNLAHTRVIFPNRRAALFFNDYLAADETPIWSPRYSGIKELFLSLSDLRPADPIETVCRLYRLFVAETGSTETLDKFYGWGERLLIDFDDVDKNMADARHLFTNTLDIKQIEADDFLTKEQRKALASFFAGFDAERKSFIRTQFLKLWEKMYDIYCRINADLAEEGLAYEGAIYRNVVERLESGKQQLPRDIEHYVFVGFNALGAAEQRLFHFMKREGLALFYWDYDTYFTDRIKHHEAGHFLRTNLREFPNELPEGLFNNFEVRERTFDFVAATSDNAQARGAAAWLKENLSTDARETAVVLCREQILQPLLHTLPENVISVNVTKGFALSHTVVYAFVERFIAQVSISKNTTVAVLNALCQNIQQQATEQRAEMAKQQAQITTDNREPLYDVLYAEAWFKAYTVVERLRRIAERGYFDSLTTTSLRRLLLGLLARIDVPFHGEPAEGLQIMGLLETRCLDFKHLIVLGATEGDLPTSASDNSFIPYFLRREFGLTTKQHLSAISAYYFFRLLSRAERVTMIYNSATQGDRRGEMSRFLLQLMVESAHVKIRHSALLPQQSFITQSRSAQEKPANMTELVRSLSPSSLNTYFRCQKLFYFEYVLHLKEPAREDDLIPANIFGTVIHNTAQRIYDTLSHHYSLPVTQAALKRYTEGDYKVHIEEILLQELSEQNWPANSLVVQVAKSYVLNLLRADIRQAPFEIVALEERFPEMKLPISTVPDAQDVTLTGFIDRLDRIRWEGRDVLRVIDYKTGGKPQTFNGLGDLFTPSVNRANYVFQTFVYAYSLMQTSGDQPLVPALFFLNQAAGKDYLPYIEKSRGEGGGYISDFRPYAAEFKERLSVLVAEIFDTRRRFQPTPDERTCASCAFAALCRS